MFIEFLTHMVTCRGVKSRRMTYFLGGPPDDRRQFVTLLGLGEVDSEETLSSLVKEVQPRGHAYVQAHPDFSTIELTPLSSKLSEAVDSTRDPSEYAPTRSGDQSGSVSSTQSDLHRSRPRQTSAGGRVTNVEHRQRTFQEDGANGVISVEQLPSEKPQGRNVQPEETLLDAMRQLEWSLADGVKKFLAARGVNLQKDPFVLPAPFPHLIKMESDTFAREKDIAKAHSHFNVVMHVSAARRFFGSGVRGLRCQGKCRREHGFPF